MGADQARVDDSGRSADGAIVPLPAVGRPDAERLTVLVAGFGGTLGTGIREVIARDPGLVIVGGSGEGDVAALVAEHRPAAALVNHEAVRNVLDVRQLVVAYPETRTLMAVMRLNRERDALLLNAGIRVVVPITIDALELCGVLRLAALGLVGPARPPRVTAGSGVGALTERETQVLARLVLRRSAREIAQELQVTEATVNTHRRHIYEKLGVHNRAELAEHASRILGSGRRKDDFSSSPSRERAPFTRRRYGAIDTGRPSMLDMRLALSIGRRRGYC